MPRLFEGEALTRLQSCWGRAQASAREQWEEAKAFGVLPEPLDGIYYANQAELNTQFPDIGSAGFGRKWFDIPRKDFWKEAEQADGDDSLDALAELDELDALDALGDGRRRRRLGGGDSMDELDGIGRRRGRAGGLVRRTGGPAGDTAPKSSLSNHVRGFRGGRLVGILVVNTWDFFCVAYAREKTTCRPRMC